MVLQEYQPYDIVHKKGILNTDADALSKISSMNAQETHMALQEISPETFKDLQKVDPTIRLLQKEGFKFSYVWNNNMVCYSEEQDKVVPFIPVGLIEQILYPVHNKSYAGHFGVKKTLDKTREIGWWPNMKTDVENWVKSCEEVYNGERFPLVIMEYLSKWVIMVPLKTIITKSIVQVLFDNGSNYVAEAMAMVCKRLDISRSLSSVEHPKIRWFSRKDQQNAEDKSGNRGRHEPKTWVQHLPFVTFAYNKATQASTKFSPFEVMFGRKARLPLLPSIIPENPEASGVQEWSDFLNERIPIIHSKALMNIKHAQEQQEKQYNKRARGIITLKVGDLVMRKNHAKMGSFPKERWTGPWKILEVKNKEGAAYKLARQATPNRTTTANVADLRIFYERENDVVPPKQSQFQSLEEAKDTARRYEKVAW
ncbi:hypothetical protein [Parasitella parasitica]|uniref:Integrase zinc-binding domain-containing protein n=1 Tax=Parasitella parasitica TaxID=35722 RepID=A0A0B7N604_9FUNG|nr:hypothetical protein [Parasitella parasitica]